MKTALFIATAFAAIILFPACGEKKELMPVVPLDFSGRPTYRGCALTTPLAGSWEAGISHGYFTDEGNEDMDFLEVTLELPQGDGNVLVPFEAAYSLSDLPEGILTKDVDDLVSFSGESNTVTFDLGTIRVTTQIPQ
ncbi:MAG: hypothetical protein P1V20_06275 [Verrucomicrobiales bacterium]|nr:hypothetical protein [Verrucomicrobiales bacterium]